MIFFEENIEPFKVHDNKVTISPIPCELKTGETGYFLGRDNLQHVMDKVKSVRFISKADLIDEQV